MIIDKNDQMYPDIVDPEVIKTIVCGNRPVFQVDVVGDEYKKCTEFSCYGSRKKNGDKYQRGNLSTASNPNAECRTGKLMEVALAKSFHGLCVDFSVLDTGDKEDFVLFGKTKIEAKCSTLKTALNRGCNYLTAIYANGAVKPVNCDIYIGGYLREDDLVTNRAKVIIAGFMLKEDILPLEIRNPPISGAKWKNRELEFSLMKPIVSLRDLYMKSVS
jgi:hypothetical protein